MTGPADMVTVRAYAETLMTSTCTIRQPGAPATDPDSGEVTTSPGAVVYSGKCRVRPAQGWGRTAVVAGQQIDPDTFQVSVPVSATGIGRGQQVHVDSCPDPDVVGRTWYVRYTPAMGDTVSARRVLCEEKSS